MENNIETKELRIGNWISNGTNYYKLDHCMLIDSLDSEKVNGVIFFERIKLTKEWLIKFELTYSGSGWYKLKDCMYTFRLTSYGMKIQLIHQGSHITIKDNIKYVHKFQNIMYELLSLDL